LVRWTKPSFQLRAAVVFAALALLYPAMRAAEIVPTQTILEIARSVNEARAGSLELRFTQEEALLQRASERPLFGWGRFGRSRVFVVDWRNIGFDSSVTDGRWIITFGSFGLFGFLAEFGLLAIPVFRAAKALRAIKSRQEAVYLSAMALIMAINMIELLPNSTLHSWSWLLAGALLGCSETVLVRERNQRPQRSFSREFGELRS
jgi:O-antigen ligase